MYDELYHVDFRQYAYYTEDSYNMLAYMYQKYLTSDECSSIKLLASGLVSADEHPELLDRIEYIYSMPQKKYIILKWIKRKKATLEEVCKWMFQERSPHINAKIILELYSVDSLPVELKYGPNIDKLVYYYPYIRNKCEVVGYIKDNTD